MADQIGKSFTQAMKALGLKRPSRDEILLSDTVPQIMTDDLTKIQGPTPQRAAVGSWAINTGANRRILELQAPPGGAFIEMIGSSNQALIWHTVASSIITTPVAGNDTRVEQVPSDPTRLVARFGDEGAGFTTGNQLPNDLYISMDRFYMPPGALWVFHRGVNNQPVEMIMRWYELGE